jgi:hypothetical protein
MKLSSEDWVSSAYSSGAHAVLETRAAAPATEVILTFSFLQEQGFPKLSMFQFRVASPRRVCLVL